METENFHIGIINEIQKNRSENKTGMPPWHDHFLDIWDLIKKAETAIDDEALMNQHRQLKKLHNAYMQKINDWLLQKQISLAAKNLLPEDKEAKEKAEALRRKCEKALYRYALCFLYLNRSLIHQRKNIDNVLKFLPQELKKSPLQLSDNIGFLLRRAYREKNEILTERQKLKNMKPCLDMIDIQFSELEKNLCQVMGEDDGAKALTGFRKALRHACYEEARENINLSLSNKTKKDHILERSEKIISLFKDNEDILRRKNEFVLSASEIGFSLSFLRTNEKRVDSFIEKYTALYLAYKYKTLLSQAYRLGQIGSFEKLFTLYEDLLTGLITPFEKSEAVQTYEGQTIRQIECILSAGTSNIPDIYDQMELAASEIRTLCVLIRECQQ